jgi:hypothetical protein
MATIGLKIEDSIYISFGLRPDFQRNTVLSGNGAGAQVSGLPDLL